ncbi:MAG: hypothetical protein QG673_2281, partial [Pseudomonadota bacterium]|nr:hypothetical protein [Pseudomonadota bacterium]
MKKLKTVIILLVLMVSYKIALACTAFGIITESGTVIGKNRDNLYYAKQNFELVMPLRQFDMWYNNNYNHQHKFYAVMVQNDVKMGVNESGLSAIEEDPLYPNFHDRKYIQPVNGNAEGMVLYGILQNFSTVSEILPYLKQIFSVAAPNFYQIADSNSILTVEVSYGNSNRDTSRKFTYRIVNKHGDYFAHTNTYLTAQYQQLNLIGENSLEKSKGSTNRLNKITEFIKSGNDKYQDWFMNMDSNLTSNKNMNWCKNTSIFRSDIQGESFAGHSIANHRLYGTVSSFIVINNGNPKTSMVYLRIIDSITARSDGTQLIKYSDLTESLEDLF